MMMNPQIFYYTNGQKYREEWFVNGMHHREDGPAYIEWHDNGQKTYELWIVNGDYHRLDGPAEQTWYTNGEKNTEKWMINDIDKTEEILQWIKEYNIQLDENSCIVKTNNKMLFRLRWA